MRFYHWTCADNAMRILRSGFVDVEWTHRTDKLHRGVWISDHTAGTREYKNRGEALLAVDVDKATDCARIDTFERSEDDQPYRRWLVPAKLLNLVARISAMDEQWTA
jgi:hypothetical protein